MARQRLDADHLALRVDAARQEARTRNTRVRLLDGEGLRLEVRPNGGASWQFVYTLNGKKKPFTIGRYPDVSLESARIAAVKARELVASGIHPLEAKRSGDDIGPISEATVRQIVDDYLNYLKQAGLDDVYLRDMERAIEIEFCSLVPDDSGVTLGEWPASEFKREYAADLLCRIKERGSYYDALRFVGWMRKCWDLAGEHGVGDPWPSDEQLRASLASGCESLG